MRRGSSERELAARWEAEAVAKAKAEAAAQAEAAAAQTEAEASGTEAAEELVRVDTGAAGEPERKAGEEQPKVPASAMPRAAEEGDARVPPRPPTLPKSKPKPGPARGLCPHGKPRSKGRSCKRSSGRRPNEYGSQRPVTVDSSKAKTSLDALKISIRQLKWKERPWLVLQSLIPSITEGEGHMVNLHWF